jgi:predicted Fe-Mo cluster-binding NifX family protein
LKDLARLNCKGGVGEVYVESSEKTAWFSILTNVLLVGIKTFVVFISGSLAVMADVIHSLSDVISSTIILLGIKISERPARGFPYGLYKVENLVAMVTSVLIHFQSIHQDIRTFGLPLSEDKLTISEHFCEAPFFRFLSVHQGEGNIANEVLLKNPFLNEEKAKGIKVVNWLLENGLDVLISRQSQTGKGPCFVLGNGGAEILLTRETNAEKALEMVTNVLGQHIEDNRYEEFNPKKTAIN